jgi:hypothetical protein
MFRKVMLWLWAMWMGAFFVSAILAKFASALGLKGD